MKATLNIDAWLRDAFRTNKPYDHFVRELITAQGSTWHNGATVMFRDKRKPEELTSATVCVLPSFKLRAAWCGT